MTTAGFNVEEIRKDFPILSRKVNGKPLVYLDNAATSQKPSSVLKIMEEYYTLRNANVHRGIHKLSEESTDAFEAARGKIARFLNAGEDEVVFTGGTTDSINIVAQSWGRKFIERGDAVILSEMEHHSNLVPWQLLSKDVGAELKFVRMNDDCSLDLTDLERLLDDNAKLVALTHASNVLGNVNQVNEIVEISHSKGVPVLLDGAQGAPHLGVDVKEVDCDFYAFSGHKMCGPTGSGVLYGKRSRLEEMDPCFGGGEMILEVGLHESSYKDPPYKFEAGTPNYIEAIGLGAAVDYLSDVGMEAIHNHECALAAYAIGEMEAIGGVEIYGPVDDRTGIISFNLEGIHPHDVSQIIDAEGVAVRAGHHCTQPLMKWLNVAATTRASFYLYNTEREVDAFVEALAKVKDVFS